MIFLKGALALALALVTLEVLTGQVRDPLPPVERSTPPPIESPTPAPSLTVDPTPTSPPPSEPTTMDPAVDPVSSCFEMSEPLLVACPGERVEGAGWELTLPERWAAIAPEEEFLPSLFGVGGDTGPFLNELGARSSARGISAIVLGRAPRSIEALGLGSSEGLRRLLSERYPDREVLIGSFSRLAGSRIFAVGSLTRDQLSSRFVLLAISDAPSLTRLAFAWAPWSSPDELYAVIGAR